MINNEMREQISVTRSSMPPMEEYIEEIRDIWDSHWLTNMGVKHIQLQRALKMYLGVENVELLVNGHMAIEMALQAMNLKGEVITTPFTFASTTHAIVRNGLTPVFCDINSKDYTIDVTKIEELITERTSAIVPVHVYGNVCGVEEIEKIAKKYNLKVIYDAAHAFGVTYKENGISSYGDVNCFSFHATKVFNTIEGGAVTYTDDQFGKVIYGLKNFGIRNEEVVDAVGANAKMNEFCAAMGLCNLRHLPEEINKRRLVYKRYMENLSDIKGVRLPVIQKNTQSNYAYFPVIIDEEIYGENRNQLRERLSKRGFMARKYFYPICNRFACYADMYEKYPTPIALDISQRVLTLPIYAGLSNEDVDEICEAISKR